MDRARRRARPVRGPLRRRAAQRALELPAGGRRVRRGARGVVGLPLRRGDAGGGGVPQPRRPHGRGTECCRGRASTGRARRPRGRRAGRAGGLLPRPDGGVLRRSNPGGRGRGSPDRSGGGRPRARPGRAARQRRGRGNGARGLLRRREQGVRGDQHDAAFRDRRARVRAPGPDLPQPDLLGAAARLRPLRRVGRARPGLPARRGGRGHQRPDGRDPARARLRRRHGLRAPPDGAVPGGAAPARGQARGDVRRASPGGPGDRRIRRHRRRSAALPEPRAGELGRPGSARWAPWAWRSRRPRC